ncbi:MAG: efflux RND transporter periplasmic adaptor subunit [Bacteroidales bacterium]|nr:efflux RND transporter periplasmic adaptor subunit [Bacteroidales bacterium]
MEKIVKIMVFAGIAAVVAGCAGKSGDKAAVPGAAAVVPSVEVVAAVSRDVPQESSYSASVEAYATNNIVSQSAGRIRKINVEVGDYVTKGQVVAEMDRLQLEQTRLQLQNDSTELARIRSLYEEGGVAKSDLEAMELGYNVRRSTYANLLENTVLRAPITGYITARNYDVNDMYAMSMPIFTVQLVVPVKLKVGISESEYSKVHKGDKVSLTVDALPGRSFTGRIERIHPTIDAATHTFLAEVVVGNSDRLLRPGMFARVVVCFGSLNNVIIPDTAVVKMEGTGQKYVYILNADNTVSFVPVTLGRHIGNEYEVTEGIAAGANVVAKGQASLKDGIAVNVL